DDGVLRLTLNDAGRRNALSEAMMGQLGAAFAEASADPSVRVVVLAANGPTFCAGHDLKEMTAGRAGPDRGRAYFTRVMALCSGVTQVIVTCPKPVIAEVAGIETAAGCQLYTRKNPVNWGAFGALGMLGPRFWPDRSDPGLVEAISDGLTPWRVGARGRSGGRSCRRCWRASVSPRRGPGRWS
ncbi:MAG TPA: enoyl-CoA hydratase-related protein, partial [Afifellaceae bacterium]|nr:enoyl-CoA hydratase-related protein [Afifellaceae bacterium]